MNQTRKLVLSLSAVLAGLILLLLVFYLMRWHGLETENVQLSSFAKVDTLRIPPRPGVQGIVITGPILRDLAFDINLQSAGVKRMNWHRSVDIDKGAVVTVRGKVEDSGRLIIRRDLGDILDPGHPSAGEEIERILSSWIYYPHMTGTIRFYFNLPSKGKKLIVDASGLTRVGTIPAKIEVRKGLLYYIEGLSSADVEYGAVGF